MITQKFSDDVSIEVQELVETLRSICGIASHWYRERLAIGIRRGTPHRVNARLGYVIAEEVVGSDSYDETVKYLTVAFEKRYHPQAQARLFGLLFTHPEECIAKTEIFPRIDQLHLRSGNHVDFFIAGY